MPAFRTTTCSEHGHREFTLTLREPPLANGQQMLLSYLEGAVARGSKFEPGHVLQLGWSMLRVCERDDGTLGLEERELTPQIAWTEAVDRALQDAWVQKEIVGSVGLEPSFPRQDEAALIAECVGEAETVVMTRLANEELPEGFSGWMLACTEEHDHGERTPVPLLAIAATSPGLVQLLALPHDTIALVMYRAKPDAPPGHKRIEPHIYRDGAELEPREGSYLAALQR